jgi:hypothetical protein
MPVKEQEPRIEVHTAKWGRIWLCVLSTAISPLVLKAHNTQADHVLVMPPSLVENQNLNLLGVSPELVMIIWRLTFHQGEPIDE